MTLIDSNDTGSVWNIMLNPVLRTLTVVVDNSGSGGSGGGGISVVLWLPYSAELSTPRVPSDRNIEQFISRVSSNTFLQGNWFIMDC